MFHFEFDIRLRATTGQGLAVTCVGPTMFGGGGGASPTVGGRPHCRQRCLVGLVVCPSDTYFFVFTATGAPRRARGPLPATPISRSGCCTRVLSGGEMFCPQGGAQRTALLHRPLEAKTSRVSTPRGFGGPQRPSSIVAWGWRCIASGRRRQDAPYSTGSSH